MARRQYWQTLRKYHLPEFKIFLQVNQLGLKHFRQSDLLNALSLFPNVNLANNLNDVRAFKLSFDSFLYFYPELWKLQKMNEQLPDPSEKNRHNFEQWQGTNSQAWTKQLRTVMIEERNIGHDWQFSDEQKERLQQYYDANKLLADCLNSDCYVSREVRQEIEDTLLLPIAEIQKRQQRG